LLRRQQIILARMGGGDHQARPIERPPDLETDAEAEAPAPPQFPLTVDEEEAQEGGEIEAPVEPDPAPPPDESPPA
jgi:hypothetical protein